jgi:hypothetical protein
MSYAKAEIANIRNALIKITPQNQSKMTLLCETYPDMFEIRVIEAFSSLVNKSKLTMVEIPLVVFECNLVKTYINLPQNDPNRETAKASLEVYLEAIAKHHNAEHPRTFVSSFFQLAGSEIKLNTSLNYFTRAHAGTVTTPKIPSKNIVITSDIQQMVQGNLLQFNRQLAANIPTEKFQYIPEKKRVVFESGVLQELIKSLVALQNQMNRHNWNNYIQTGGFLDLHIVDKKE